MAKVNLDFAKGLPRVEEAETVIACFQCSACVAECPAAAHPPRFNPRDIVLKVLLGLEEELLRKDSVVWDCATCYTCMERCPQGVRPIEVITALKNLLAARGMLPPEAAAAENIRRTDRVIVHSEAVDRHRKELGLPHLSAEGKRIEEVMGCRNTPSSWDA